VISSLRRLHRLPTGRSLCFDEHNPGGARPVFYFHGAPSARVDFRLFDVARELPRLDLRVLAVDRPGLGGSGAQARRHLLDWPRDVAALADGLGLDRFAVLGWSGGGPYALACGHVLGERVTAVGVVSSLAPLGAPGLAAALGPNRRFLQLARDFPAATLLQLRAIARLARTPWLAQASLRALFSGRDREALESPEVARAVVDYIAEAMAQGGAGAQEDLAILAGRWGFDPAAVARPVVLFHGEADRNAPVELGRYLAGVIPGCRATFLRDEGHLSIVARHGRAILEALAAR